MNEREMAVWIDEQRIGTLRERQSLWAFEYTDAWRSHPAHFALSPHMPVADAALVDGATVRPIQWYFDNLLPEESARTLLAKDAKVADVSDAFGLLEYYGRESAGSLTLCSPEDPVETRSGMRALPDTELNERIRQLPTLPLTHGAPKKMSLAGAQHKLAVIVRDGELFEPEGQAASTHILKPNHPQVDDYPHSVINEWFVMKLAKRVGLDVPQVDRRYVPAPVYLIERFDRVIGENSVRRRHAIDGCQLLNLAASMKYSAWSVDALSALADACRTTALARLRIYRWLVFCVIVGNGDCHLKNLSFLVGHDGVALAPHYDLLSESVYETPEYSARGRWPDLVEFTRPIDGVQRYSQITPEILLGAGKALGINEAVARRNLGEMVRIVTVAADELLADVAKENDAIMEKRPELAATFGGEMRCLRAIRHTVIEEAIRRLDA
ncbi:HipA domain-containing protein [Pandoraea sp. PE-S2R-1]|uniref:HipA domain-containing protein n=1 Tax=Pandoraea sp. PE-S2R-1 TaxID=1986994 RepID=UPI000B3F790A|nr:HipA domain-containing protein [Pandoraea sp. PE-S2R-1]